MSETDAVGELSSYDQHTTDQGAETFEREKDLGLLLSTYMQLEQVLVARDRLECTQVPEEVAGDRPRCLQAFPPRSGSPERHEKGKVSQDQWRRQFCHPYG